MTIPEKSQNREPDQDRLLQSTFADADALRAHLDALNEAGEPPIAVGWDGGGGKYRQPFLITLVGPYAEGEAVFFDSPWAGHDIVNAEIHCVECRGEECGIGHLRFPVTVVTTDD